MRIRPQAVLGRQGRRAHRWRSTLLIVAALLGLAALVVDYGFFETPLAPDWVLAAVQVAAAATLLVVKAFTWISTRAERRPLLLDLILLALLGLGMWIGPGLLGQWPAELIRWRLFQLYLLANALVQVARFSMAAAASGRAPARALLASFVAIIFAGALLLMLPAAHRQDRLGFTDAVFTATSATCVTGLIVRDTGTSFTRLGQAVILVLIQVGGLGIMIFGALFAMLLGTRLSLRESLAMRDIMNEQSPARIGRMVVLVCAFTFVTELVGVGCSYGMWQTDPVSGGQGFKTVFHAVSAFCNAGFSLQADSLSGYRGGWQVYLVIAPLIVLGGLGFPVWDNLLDVVLSRRRQRRRRRHRGPPVRVSLHSRMALVTTAALLAGGWVLLAALELPAALRPEGTGPWACLRDAWFNSVTARTAGFNTVDISGLSSAGQFTLVLLMSIGGSPGSTAGGIKTVTLGIMVLTVLTTMRRHEQVNAFRRRIPVGLVRRASTLMLLYGLLLWLLTLLLSITEAAYHWDLLDLLFEAASALGTVGLSTGVTEHLTVPGRWIIIVAMLIGRLGPLSLLAALAATERQPNYEYPTESLVVG